MKKMKKLVAFLLTFVMVMAMGVAAMAAGTGTITITPPTGTDANAKTTYTVYKVFDADGNGTNISYKLAKGTSLTGDMATYFDVDSAGNVTAKDAAKDAEGKLTAGAISAIAAYVQGDTAVATVEATGTTAVTVNNLANGYYYVTTTTGTAVSITSTNPNAQVNDKNGAPTVDKKITGASSFDQDGKKALAELGSTVTYTVTVTLGNGSQNVKFHDKLGTGLTFDGNAKVIVSGIDAANYTIETTPAEGDTLTISFKDGTTGTATITYTATVNSDALTVDTGKNTATISYGHDGKTTSTPSETNVYNAKFTVTKTDGNNQPLAGAGFVISKRGTDGVVYYQKKGNDVNWVSDINQATELKTTADSNVVAFTGLANGIYTLVEKTVPAGYNKAADSTFTVAEHDYGTTNLVQAKTVVNNAGSALPSTGGIGTTIFYVIGAILVLGAGVLLVTRRRMASK